MGFTRCTLRVQFFLSTKVLVKALKCYVRKISNFNCSLALFTSFEAYLVLHLKTFWSCLVLSLLGILLIPFALRLAFDLILICNLILRNVIKCRKRGGFTMAKKNPLKY